MPIRRVLVVLTAVGALGASFSTAASAADPPFGGHVSDCAQMSLGQREGAPAVTCTHDGTTMTFANFGQMVQHMLEDR